MRIPISGGRIPGRFYQIQHGDSMGSISQNFEISIENILKFNEQMTNTNVIFPGEILFIPTSSYLTKSKKSKINKRKKTIRGKKNG